MIMSTAPPPSLPRWGYVGGLVFDIYRVLHMELAIFSILSTTPGVVMASQVRCLAVGLENSALPRIFHRISGACVYCVSG